MSIIHSEGVKDPNQKEDPTAAYTMHTTNTEKQLFVTSLQG